MPNTNKLSLDFLRAAIKLANSTGIDHLLYVSDIFIPSKELRGKACKKKLIYAVTSEKLAERLRKQKYSVVLVPPYDYSRAERIKIALIAATSSEKIKNKDISLCVTGLIGRPIDTLMQVQVGNALDKNVAVEGVKLGERFNSQVIDALIQLAMQIGQEGFEGHPIGTILTIGDCETVMSKSRQLTLNPFQGIPETERNILDPKIREAIKNFSVLDGAFVIREDGVVLAAGRYLTAIDDNVQVPLGLGARHTAAASITSTTECLALAVSQTSGAVRFFKDGAIILELHQASRRI
ncbi:MAG: diadenylate cyclase [Cystobacterineae bacterium]|nr:diadenylate cyclase [Cystobacterineae bacterium]